MEEIRLKDFEELSSFSDSDYFYMADNAGNEKRGTLKKLTDFVAEKIRKLAPGWQFEVKTESKTIPGAINNLKDEIVQTDKKIEDKIVSVSMHLQTRSDWVVVKKDGYELLNAYLMINDSSKYLRAISKTNDDRGYILLFSGINEEIVDVSTIWRKL